MKRLGMLCALALVWSCSPSSHSASDGDPDGAGDTVGAGGAAGTGGTAGSGGAAGTGGAGGSGGTAGTGGGAGSGGTAGTGGSAGSGGAAGTGGSAGSAGTGGVTGGDDGPPGDGDISSGDGDLPGGDADTDPCNAPYGFWDLLDAVSAAAPAARQDLVDSWLASHGPNFPYTEGSLVTFSYRGSPSDVVFLAGDHNGWDPAADQLALIPNTDVFHQTWCMPPEARIDYKLVVNGNWILDPQNPYTIDGGYGPNSELRMPAWVYPTEIDYSSAVPHGSINGATVGPGATYSPLGFYSGALANTRDVFVYLPPAYDTGSAYPTLYVQDGGEYISLASMPNVLDNLLAAGIIEPLIVVFVSPVDRNSEYVGAQISQYVSMIATELVPYIDSQYATDASSPARRGVMGTSNGGFISMRITRDHPELFERVGSQSGALRADGGTVIGSFAAASVPAAVRLYFDCGLIGDFTTANRDMRDALTQGGYVFGYDEYPEGHSWGNWRAHLDELVPFLFPR